jgi:hypothetical protein
MGEAESGTVFVGRFAAMELDPICLAARTTTEGLVEGDVSVNPFLSEEAALLAWREKKEANEAELFCKVTPATTSPRVDKTTTTLNLVFNK